MGRLDAIEHESGKFELVLDQGGGLTGRLKPDALDSQVLSALQGQQVTVMGTVRFAPAGQLQFVEARGMTARVSGDDVFDELPSADAGKPWGALPGPSRSDDSARPRDLVGAWPGDEPVEELLALLD